MALVTILTTASVALLGAFYIYRRYFAHRKFEKEGIPGPEPNWLLGNIAEMADESRRHLVIPRWTKKYGSLFGYYEGSTPTIVTSDPSFIDQIYIKQFPSFHGRKRLPIQPNPDSTNEPINMLLARGHRWKRLRTLANPVFSATKLRAVMPLLDKCQDDFMDLIDRKTQNNEEFNIFDCFKMLTLDTISESAFGIELNGAKSFEKSENPVYEVISGIMRNIFKFPLSFKLSLVLPELAPLLRKIEFFRAKVFGTGMMKYRSRLYEMIEKIIDSRHETMKTNSANVRQDLLQLMLAVEDRSDSPAVSEYGYKGLSLGELQGQCMLFLIAGYETSSNALAFCTFLLANNPQVQEKLIGEIDDHFHDQSIRPHYNNVHELPYLEAVVNETLRLYPVAPLIINREAMEEAVVNGVHIPQGMNLMADVWSLHRDDEQWGPEDTEKFYPERFLPDYPSTSTRNEAAFIPFGYGPRICIGKRFALLEIKLTLINLLRKYRIVKSARTGEQMRLNAGFTITPIDGIWVKLDKRQ